MDSISLEQFTRRCEPIFDRVRKTGAPILVTDQGIVIAEIHPPSTIGKKGRIFGGMRDDIEIVGDIISPASDESDWAALEH